MKSLTPSQVDLLQYLKRAGPSNAKQIAAAWRVTPMAIRNHLAVLEKAGLVTTNIERRRRGRPSYLFSVTEDAETLFPNDYGNLTNRLLRAIGQLEGEATLAQLFAQVRGNAVAQYASRMTGKVLEERVAEMAKIQSELGYMADCSRLDENTLELIEHNCAILQVARNCPHACQCELTMMQELIGAPVFRQEHIASGDSCCRYLIQRIPRSARKRRPGPHPAKPRPQDPVPRTN